MEISVNFILISIFSIISLIFANAEEVTSAEYALFENILRDSIGNETIDSIVSIEKKSVTKRKSNFSYLSRVIIVYTANYSDGATDNNRAVNKTIKFIMKNEPKAEEMTDATKSKYIQKMKLFETEATMLRDIVPWIAEAVGRKIGPKFYYYSESDKILVMEDLGFSNFINRDFAGGMTDDDVILVLELLAQFHAGSVLLHERNSTIVSNYNTGIINENLPEDSFTNCSRTLRSLGNYLKNSNDVKLKSISQKLMRIADVLKTELQDLYKITEDDLAVLNHGDCWSNNFMFNDDENGKVRDIRFIDFQLSVWAPHSIDLVYFFGGTRLITPTFHHDEYIQIYLNKLTETMMRIGCSTPAPTLQQLKQSMQKHRANMILGGLILASVERAHQAGLDINSIDETQKSPWEHPDIRLVIDRLLPMLDDNGYLD